MKNFALIGLVGLAGCSAAGADIDDKALNRMLTDECMSKIEQNLDSSGGGILGDFTWDSTTPDNLSINVDRKAMTFSLTGAGVGRYSSSRPATVDVSVECEGKFDYAGSDRLNVTFTNATDVGTFQ